MWQSIKDFFSKLFAPVEKLPESPSIKEPVKADHPGLQAALSWELPCNDGQVNQKSHPERREWSTSLYVQIEKNYDLFMSASDIKTIIPNLDLLNKEQRITCLCELMSTVAEYECSWNAASTSKDVNGRSETEYLATGLFQMNTKDQGYYHTGTSYTHEELKNPMKNIEVGVAILVYLLQKRGKLTYKVGEKSSVIGYFYATLLTDGKVGGKVIASAKKRIAALNFGKLETVAPAPQQADKKSPPWYTYALKFKGKNESDPAFNKEMSKKWSLFEMNLGTIAESWAAWCGLAMAVCLAGVGVDYQKNGALARNWQTYGVEISWKQDGIPQGAIVQINHGLNCKSGSSNHVAQANGDCTAADLVKSGGTLDLYGGNQGNTWKVSTYSAKEICAVRWPKDVKDYPKPGKILKSVNCTSVKSGSESTR